MVTTSNLVWRAVGITVVVAAGMVLAPKDASLGPAESAYARGFCSAASGLQPAVTGAAFANQAEFEEGLVAAYEALLDAMGRLEPPASLRGLHAQSVGSVALVLEALRTDDDELLESVPAQLEGSRERVPPGWWAIDECREQRASLARAASRASSGAN